jgi:hypothetical protein
MITDDNGCEIDFIENINMRSDKQESTGVVTRFTTSEVTSNKSYPVKLHLLSVADFITILTDSYMNDITGYQPYSETDLKGFVERFIEKYSDGTDVQNHLTEDEVAVYKRGRNAKSHTSAKNASIQDSRKATGFEALMGYLYLTGQTDRLLDLVQSGVEKVGLKI